MCCLHAINMLTNTLSTQGDYVPIAQYTLQTQAGYAMMEMSTVLAESDLLLDRGVMLRAPKTLCWTGSLRS